MSTPTGATPEHKPQPSSSEADQSAESSPFALGREYFTVRVTSKEQRPRDLSTDLGAAMEFWFEFDGPNFLATGPLGIVEKSDWIAWAEKRLTNDFPRYLLDEAKRFRSSHSWAANARAVEPAFSFRVGNIRYGSLIFDASVSSVGALVKYLHDDPELVLAFLDLCVPRAFEDTFNPNSGRPVITTFPGEALQRALTEAGASPSDKEKESKGPSGKTTWSEVFQRASQVAWLLPTILALVVLYVGAGMLSAERDRVHARETALDGIGKQLHSSDEDRISKLEALTLSLVQQARSVKDDPKVMPCCPACCPVAQCQQPAPASSARGK